MSGDDVTRAIAACAAGVAAVSLCWAVASWRLAGPALRIHCHMYGQALEIRIFNAGRVSDTIEQLEIGSHRRTALTGLLELPTRVDPGQSKRWVVGIDHLPRRRVDGLRAGWLSIWVLTGSMRQRRAEVIPSPLSAPPGSGWALVPRRARLYRLVPLTSSVLAALASMPGSPRVAGWGIGILGVGAAAWAMRRAVGSKTAQFSRRKVERWTSLSAVAVGLLGYIASGSVLSSTLPVWVQALLTLQIALSFYLALPRVGDLWAEAQERVHQGRRVGLVRARSLAASARGRVSRRLGD